MDEPAAIPVVHDDTDDDDAGGGGGGGVIGGGRVLGGGGHDGKGSLSGNEVLPPGPLRGPSWRRMLGRGSMGGVSGGESGGESEGEEHEEETHQQESIMTPTRRMFVCVCVCFGVYFVCVYCCVHIHIIIYNNTPLHTSTHLYIPLHTLPPLFTHTLHTHPGSLRGSVNLDDVAHLHAILGAHTPALQHPRHNTAQHSTAAVRGGAAGGGATQGGPGGPPGLGLLERLRQPLRAVGVRGVQHSDTQTGSGSGSGSGGSGNTIAAGGGGAHALVHEYVGCCVFHVFVCARMSFMTCTHSSHPPTPHSPPTLPPDARIRLSFAALLVGHRMYQSLPHTLRQGVPVETSSVFGGTMLSTLCGFPEAELVAPLPRLMAVLDSHAGMFGGGL